MDKSLKDIIIANKSSKEEKKSFIGAIPINTHIKVKLNNEEKICKIISIRPEPLNKNEEPLTEYSYEYYIHYIEYDKRNDHWIKRKDILNTKINDKEIKKLKNKKEITFHNGNDGYEKQVINAHKENVKVCTIEEIVMGYYRCPTLYFSPFPEEYHNNKVIFFVNFVLIFI